MLIHDSAENCDSLEPEGGYDKKTQDVDMRAVVTALGYDKTFVVAQDIGDILSSPRFPALPDSEAVKSSGLNPKHH